MPTPFELDCLSAVAHELNEELTIILNATEQAMLVMGIYNPARAYIFDIQCAAQRCAWKAKGMHAIATRTVAKA